MFVPLPAGLQSIPTGSLILGAQGTGQISGLFIQLPALIPIPPIAPLFSGIGLAAPAFVI
jgi:hypothetical protein